MTRSEPTKSTAAEQLVDIRDVKIDRSLPSEERIKSFIEQIKNPYQFKVGNTVVRVSFANTQKIMNAFREHRVSEANFAASSGYGYDD